MSWGDSSFFQEEADDVSVLVLGVWCCSGLWQVKESMDAAVGLNGRGSERGTVHGWSFLYSACRLLLCSLMTVLPLGCCRWQRHWWLPGRQQGGCVGVYSRMQKETPCFPAHCQGPWWRSSAGDSWCSSLETCCGHHRAGEGLLQREGHEMEWREDSEMLRLPFTLLIPCVYCSASDCWVLCFVLHNML